MNCPKDRSKMEYVSEMSEPRFRKLVWYCDKCRAYRITYEPSKDKLIAMLLDSIELDNILAPRKEKMFVS